MCISGPVVFFYAWNNKTLSNFAQGTVLVFDNAITNSGNGYNSSKGVFRAPIASAYVFSWTIVVERGNFINIALKKNGAIYGMVQSDGFSGHNNGAGSNTAIIELKVGDDVYLEVNSDAASTHQVFGGGYSTFSGWLLHY